MTSTKFACPCCRYLTLEEEPPGTFDICPVCGWEDDDVQFRDADFEGGANVMSLTQARENFRSFGAKSRDAEPRVRSPRPEEVPPSEKPS